VVTTTNGAYVYVRDAESKAKRVVVKAGRQSGAVTKIDSGLVGGEEVIVEGQSRLTDGSKVELRPVVTDRPRGVDVGVGGGAGRRSGGRRGGDSTQKASTSGTTDSTRTPRKPGGTPQ
jgi:multidrug efflux system membrane fusion protein